MLRYAYQLLEGGYMQKRVILVLLILAAAAGVALAGGTKEPTGKLPHIVIATDATWPPMEMVNEQKQIVGFDIDLMNAAAKAGGFTVEFRNTAWDGIFAGLEAGEYDAVMSSVTITDERKQTMDFSVPYINAGQILVVRKELMGVDKLDQLKGKSVGAQIGTTGAFEIEKVPGVNLKTYDEIGLAFEDLVNGRIDAVVCDTPVAAQFALQNDNYKGKLKIVGKPFTNEYYGVAVKKGNTKVLDLINKGLEKVLNTSTYKQIEAKWLR
jgi:polar amino acid transport system substrate-binding protein